MKTRSTRSKLFAMTAALVMLTAAFAVVPVAQQIQCSSLAGKVAAVTNPAGHTITKKYQLDNPNLQPLLKTTINSKQGCLVAHLSGLARITDNYIVFQVRVDGVPMKGHLPGYGGVNTPAVFVSIDEGGGNNDEQSMDPTKVVAYNFFSRLDEGAHTVEVWAAAGSNIVAPHFPTVSSLVLTLEYP